MDDEDANAVEQHASNPMREAYFERVDAFWDRALRFIAQYRGNRLMALDCFYVATGRGEMIGCQTAVDVAVRHFKDAKKKATTSRCIGLIHNILGVDGMPGQRSVGGKREMSNARRKQLNGKEI